MIDIGPHLAAILAGAFVTALKVITVIVAYKVVKLGHDLLLRGIKGEFTFSTSVSGLKADLQSASPGLLFVLLGCGVMAFAIFVQFPQKAKTTASQPQSENSYGEMEILHKAPAELRVPPEHRDLEAIFNKK